MELNLTTIVILILVLLAGYGIGLLKSHLRNSRKLKVPERESGTAGDTKDLTGAVPGFGPAAMQVWLTPGHILGLELDGSRVELPASISPEQRRRLLTLLTKIRPWVEAGPIAPPSQAAQVSSGHAAAAQSPLAPTPDAGIVLEVPASRSSKSMVLQIDDVLQKLLTGTPLEKRRIMLRESPGGGVLVNVGADQYDGIDAVPEPAIQAIIRQAAAEWEKGTI